MSGSMVDIQSVTAEIRRGKKKKETTGQKYNVHICYAGRPSQNDTRMWANAQRDGRPTKYRWRPLFNAAKFG